MSDLPIDESIFLPPVVEDPEPTTLADALAAYDAAVTDAAAAADRVAEARAALDAATLTQVMADQRVTAAAACMRRRAA